MPTAAGQARASSSGAGSRPSLTRRLASQIIGVDFAALEPAVVDKAKTCLLDLLACALEARSLPASRQAAALASLSKGGANVIGTPLEVSPTDAAFTNAIAAHGLVQEDMHAGSVSHLGVAVLPTLLAVAQQHVVHGRDWIAATVAGYETGARIGRALLTPELTRLFRPTGITGPLAGAAAAARLLRLSEDVCANALGLAANMASGLNEWPRTGGSEMYFHAGLAARSAFTAITLAGAGAYASPEALEGEAGLFAAYRRQREEVEVRLFVDGNAEIMAVYFKPFPACNFAQTPCQAALALAREDRIDPAAVAAVRIRVSRAAHLYPGCDYAGRFDRSLQAKMSIQYGVAVALAHGRIDEGGYADLANPMVARLMSVTELSESGSYTAAFPAVQGAEVEIVLKDGSSRRRALADVVPASADEVRQRFLASASSALGMPRARDILAFVDGLERAEDVGRLGKLVAA